MRSLGYCSVGFTPNASLYLALAPLKSFTTNFLSASEMRSAYFLSIPAAPIASSQALILSFGYCSIDLITEASTYFMRALV